MEHQYLVEAKYAMDNFPVSTDSRSQDVDPALLGTHVGKWIRGWTGSPKWLNFGLVYDEMYLPTTLTFPHLTSYIQTVENECGPISMAGLSWMLPGCSIPPHTDECVVNKEDNVHHLGILVPHSCGLIVDKKHYSEAVGKSIWFNDGKTHSAYNNSTGDRVILYVKLA